jgi:hypothetical protein
MEPSFSFPDFAPDAERLSLAPVWENLAVVCAGAAIIFAAAVILYFILRGRREY